MDASRHCEEVFAPDCGGGWAAPTHLGNFRHGWRQTLQSGTISGSNGGKCRNYRGRTIRGTQSPLPVLPAKPGRTYSKVKTQDGPACPLSCVRRYSMSAYCASSCECRRCLGAWRKNCSAKPCAACCRKRSARVRKRLFSTNPSSFSSTIKSGALCLLLSRPRRFES